MIKVLNFFLKSSWKQILLISIVSVIAAGLNVLSIKFLKDMVTSVNSDVFLSMSIVAVLVISSGVITLLIERYSTKYFEQKLAGYREELSTNLLSVPYEKINGKLDRLAPVLLFEITEVSDFGKLIPGFIVAFIQVVTIMIYLVVLSWQLSLIVLILFIVVISLMFFALPAVKKLKEKHSKTRYRLHVMFLLMSQGFKDLIMSTKHGRSYVLNSIRPPSMDTAMHNVDIQVLKITIEQIINALLILGFGISIIFYLNWEQASQELAVQFMALLLFILPSFIKIIHFFNQIKNAENALDQIKELDADIRDNSVVPKEEINIQSQKGKALITIKNLEYSFNDNDHGFRLGPVNLEIYENEITIINGGNGSGKTTLLNLLVGLYESKNGAIYLQSTMINNDNISSYRDLFSSYFTDSPVFDNLEYIPEDNFKKSIKYIKDLGLEGKTSISTTNIAQTNLSFGQRGRLNLLRLLLEDRPIYILDEWAANQDIQFKEKFYKEIVPDLKARGKTVILISHDDKYYNIADSVITMRNGLIESVKRNQFRT